MLLLEKKLQTFETLLNGLLSAYDGSVRGGHGCTGGTWLLVQLTLVCLLHEAREGGGAIALIGA
jgi:hypothetical protein